SIDANRGDQLLGWDTDQFPTDVSEIVGVMLVILNQGGLAPGGLNFDAKVRRASTDLEDLFHAHIGGMGTFALGLEIAHQIKQDGVLSAFIRERYSGYDSGIGHRVEAAKTDFKELEKYALEEGEPELRSGRQEKLENIMNHYLFGRRAQ